MLRKSSPKGKCQLGTNTMLQSEKRHVMVKTYDTNSDKSYVTW